MTNELGSRQRDLSTLSVTKRANRHWHAVISIQLLVITAWVWGSRCTALIHPFASEPSGSGWSYCSPFHRRVFWKTSAGLTAQQQWSLKYYLSADSHTKSVRWPAPLRSSALKEQHGWSRLYKDVLSPVRFWMWSLSGTQDGHDCCLVPGHSARWGNFRGWFMFFLWRHDHLGVA